MALGEVITIMCDSTEQKLQPLREYASVEYARHVAYHNHKETVAYVCLGIYVAAMGSILASNNWPPFAWWPYSKVIAIFLQVFLWLGLAGQSWRVKKLAEFWGGLRWD